MQENLRKLKKRTGEASDSESDEESRKRRRGPSFLEEELAKYQKGRGRAIMRSANTRKRREEEDDLLAAMTQFSKKVSDVPLDAIDDGEALEGIENDGDEPLEVDDDVDWIRHSLKFLVDEKELTRRAEDEYAVSRDWGWDADFRSSILALRQERLRLRRRSGDQAKDRAVTSNAGRLTRMRCITVELDQPCKQKFATATCCSSSHFETSYDSLHHLDDSICSLHFHHDHDVCRS